MKLYVANKIYSSWSIRTQGADAPISHRLQDLYPLIRTTRG